MSEIRVGDRVKVVKPSFSFDEVGDVLTVDKVDEFGIVIYDKNHPKTNSDFWGSMFEWVYFIGEIEKVEDEQ